MMLYSTLPQQGGGGYPGIDSVILVWLVVFTILTYAAMWQIYEKAGQPGWAVLVPFYNYWVLFEIVGKPGTWFLWAFIPFVFPIIIIIALWELARSFGKGGGWAIGLILLAPIFLFFLGFGNAEYIGPGGAPAAVEETSL